MSSGENVRRLTSIMFTDIKGYTAMMGANEKATVELVLEHREIVRACVDEFDGHEHETIGDAFVVMFDSVVNAVKCAVEIQARLAERNAEKDEEKQVWIRIGVHLGDIILRDGGIYGDAVNLAARVQDRGQPGGVCITEQVKLQITGRVDVPIEPMGEVPLKGILHPPALYRLALPSARGPAPVPKVAESAASGRKLIAAAAVLVLAIGVAFAINGSKSKAESTPTGATMRPTMKASPAADKKVEAAAKNAEKAEKAAEKATGKAAGPRPKPAEQPAAAAAKKDEIANAARDMARDKVAEAMAANGKRRVQLLTEAATLDPDDKSIQRMLAVANKEVEAAEAKARKRAHHATDKARRVKHKPAPKPSASAPERKVKPRVVLD